ncbi:RluA family pseudouridine synthase [bacterium]|nr:RluA family pseudouridine synthase [bacterium]
MISILVNETESRLDRFLHQHYPQVSTNRWRQVLKEGGVLVDGRRGVKGEALIAGQTILIPEAILSHLTSVGPEPELKPALEIIYEDQDLLAINKPVNCHTHPLSVSETGTLANHLISVFPELIGVGGFGPLQPGLLNRLDYATSGVVLAARNNSAWNDLREQFAAHLVGKEYLAQVGGELSQELVVEKDLTHDENDRRKMVPSPPAPPCRGLYPARTAIFPLTYDPHTDVTKVRLVMCSGVMHQLRAHLADSGHPLIGDSLYGGRPLVSVENEDVSFGAEMIFYLHCSQVILPDGRKILTAPAWS